MDDINTINEGSGQKSPASASGQKGKKAHGEGSGTHRLIYDKLDKDNNGTRYTYSFSARVVTNNVIRPSLSQAL
jgi:hypothetical protein